MDLAPPSHPLRGDSKHTHGSQREVSKVESGAGTGEAGEGLKGKAFQARGTESTTALRWGGGAQGRGA